MIDKNATSPDREIAAIARVIGQEGLVKVLSGMSEREVSEITQIAAQESRKSLKTDEATIYMKKFMSRIQQLGVFDAINADFIHSEISKKRRFSSGKSVNASLEGFILLSDKEPEDVVAIIGDQSIYIKAVILSNIDYGVSQKVISLYPVSEQIEIFQQMDECENTDIKFLEHLSETLVSEIKDKKTSASNGGIKSIVQVVERMAEPQVLALLAKLDEEDPELAQKIRDNIMTFEDIIALDESVLEVIFDNIEPKGIAHACRDIDPEDLFKVLETITKKKQETVQEEMKMAENLPDNVINDAKKRVITVAKDMETKGLISLAQS